MSGRCVSGTAPALRGGASFKAALLFASLAALSACDDDLPKATEIVHMRVIGAQLQVLDDEERATERATPKPGETVRVSLATVFPGLEREDGNFVPLQTKQRRVRSLIVGCTAPDRYTGGIPVCQELIDIATGAVDAPLPEEIPGLAGRREECPGSMSGTFGALSYHCMEGLPVFELQIPKDYRPNRILFSGIVCERGNAGASADAQEPFFCANEGEEAIRVHGLIPVQQKDSDANDNPDIGALKIQREVNGGWNPVRSELLTPENETMCQPVSESLPGDRADLPLLYGNIDFKLSFNPKARDDFEGKPEPLEITLYATHGEMERRFTVFDPDDTDLTATLRYTPPKKDIPDRGQLVRFYATVRDQRGGFSMAEYALCVGQLLLPERK